MNPNLTMIEAARAALAAANRILVMAHIRPDGDAVGSALGLGLGLLAQGKDVQIVLADGVPAPLRYMAGYEKVRTKPEGEFDLTVALDTADQPRLGKALPEGRAVDLNIDHHATNPGFGRINLIEPDAAATAEILAKEWKALGLPRVAEADAALLAGILSDTQGFRTPNTTPNTLRLAADLADCGAPLAELYYHAQVKRTFEAVRLWGFGVARVVREDALVWTSVTAEDRKAAGYAGRDDADLVNWLSSIEGARVVVVFTEQDAATVKVSWRASDATDVAAVAGQFGGGGHRAAAGAVVKGSLAEVQEQTLAATRLALK